MPPAPPSVFDVRPLVARGEEPLPSILHAIRKLPAGGQLILLAPFEPVPLLDLLGQQGHQTDSSQQAEDLWEIKITSGGADDADARDVVLHHLPMESATSRILRECETLGRNQHLTVHLSSLPPALLHVLGQHGFESDAETTPRGGWTVRIWRMLLP